MDQDIGLNRDEVNDTPYGAEVVNPWNPVVLRNILSYIKAESPSSLKALRLVSPAFNQAVLALPYPTPIRLNLSYMFPHLCCPCCGEDDEDENDYDLLTPDVMEKVEPKLTRYVMMIMVHRCDHVSENVNDVRGVLKLPTSATINFNSFSQIYGSNVQSLVLNFVEEWMLKPIALGISRHCRSLKRLELSIYECACGDEVAEEEEDPFKFNVNDRLVEVKFYNGRYEDEGWKGVCFTQLQFAKALVKSAPNLETFISNTNMLFDFSGNGRLFHLCLEIFPCRPFFSFENLNKVLQVSAGTLENLHLHFDCVIDSDRDAAAELFRNNLLHFPPMPKLAELFVWFPSEVNFAAILIDCIFSPVTASLRSLTISTDDDSTLEQFLFLIRDHSLRKDTLRKFQIEGESSGIEDINQLLILQAAFPNLAVLRLAGVGREGDPLKDILDKIKLWMDLREFRFRINGRLKFTDLLTLAELGIDYWTNGGRVKKIKLKLGHPRKLFPSTEDLNPDISAFEKLLLDMRGMEEVTFVDFVMPSAINEKLVRLIILNALPVSFVDKETEDF